MALECTSYKNDIEKATQIIKDKLEPDNIEITCPFCGSKDIKLGFGKNKGFKIFNILIAFLMLIPIGNLKPKYYCRSCKNGIE